MSESYVEIYLVDDDISSLHKISSLLCFDNPDEFNEELQTSFTNSSHLEMLDFMMHSPEEWKTYSKYISCEFVLGHGAEEISTKWALFLSELSPTCIVHTLVSSDDDGPCEKWIKGHKGKITVKSCSPFSSTAGDKKILSDIYQWWHATMPRGKKRGALASKLRRTYKKKQPCSNKKSAVLQKKPVRRYTDFQSAISANDFEYLRDKLTLEGIYAKRSFDTNPESMFMYAVKTNNEQLIDLMIDKGYDIHSNEPHGYPTILHWACSQYMYWEDIGASVPKLIELGVDPNTQGRNGLTPLYHAVKNRQVDAVKNLLRYGADPNLGSPRGITPIFNVDNLEILNTLIDAGADCHKKTTRGQCCLNEAVYTQRADIVKRMLEVGCDVDHQQNDGKSPLHFCRHSYHQEVAQLLLAHRANPNLCDKNGATPIVEVFDLTIFTALAKAGADLNHANNAGKTCLFMAVTYNQVDLVKGMIDLGCNVNHQDNEGRTPLFYIEGDKPEWTRATSPVLKVAKLLLENGADPNHRDRSGATVIHKVDNLLVLNALVKAGADVHKVDSSGQTCLFNAVKNVKVDMVKRMINLRCDVNHQDNEGSTPLFYCNGSERIWSNWNSLHLEIAILLLEAGADPGIEDNENYRAFDYEGAEDLENLLIENEYIVYSEDGS